MSAYKVNHSIVNGQNVDIHLDVELTPAVVDAEGKEITPATYRRVVVTVDKSHPETWDAQMASAAE